MQLLLPMLGNRWRIGSGPSSDVVVLDSGGWRRCSAMALRAPTRSTS